MKRDYVDNPFESPAVLSFCPGILGIERGLARASVHCRVVAYVEIESFIIANLVAGMEAGVLDSAPIWTDAKTFDALPFRGRIHGIIGGYPCPGESLAGLREGHLYKGFIWPSIRRAIAAARPLWCFFENVDDHLTGTYPIVQRSLRNMGYAVEAGIYSTEEVGGTCERQRIFILAVADSYLQQSNAIREWIRGKSNSGSNEVGRTDMLTGRQNSKGRLDMAGDLLQKTKWNESPNRIGATSTKMDGAEFTGLEGYWVNARESELTKLWYTGYPMGQGYQQYEWEPPRVESRMVYNVSGYNFREDLVRAVGNSVDENVAELAFRDLIRKHFA